ncbi:Dabb family protein [Acetobacter conturbans]|uniref:Dabb family protein n=1 Tax=Acetobacter conturbans TaxID=1737472 RepID=A0ABX0JXB1_9PROT|nr:Dabb family protein [Acetobacter conturbans]NHN87974.1 Dabb family protein [Acetobacter conturbans]
MTTKISPRLLSTVFLAAALNLLAVPSGHAAAQRDDAARHAEQVLHEVGVARFTAPDFQPGTIRHMVMFRFRPNVTQAERDEVTKRFLALAKLSHRSDGKSVVVSIEAGPQNSGENSDLGLEAGYLVTFASEGDRNFYVGHPIVSDSRFFDHAHDAFKAFAGPYLEKVVVFDFPVISESKP